MFQNIEEVNADMSITAETLVTNNLYSFGSNLCAALGTTTPRTNTLKST
jgi:uncharacterized membrane protein YoaK (UPF0700 family)